LGVPLHLGLFGRWGLGPRAGLQVEGMVKWAAGYGLSAEAYGNDPVGTGYHVVSSDQLLFLELPVLFQWRKERSLWAFGAKPALNFALKAKTERVGAPLYEPDMSIRKGLQRWDVGLVLGWQYRIAPNLAVDLRYVQGLQDLSYDDFFRDNGYLLNSGLQVSLFKFWD
jgi:hypothetical protein